MARDQIPVSVAFRDVPLFRRATLCDVDGSGGFVPTDSPMPVGTALVLSPLRNSSVQVTARVALVVEACRTQATQGESAGMNVTFEEAGESLLDYLEAGSEEELAQVEVAGAIERPQAAPPSTPSPATPKVIVEGEVESTTTPAAGAPPGDRGDVRTKEEVVVVVAPPGGDPDAPDKEVVELEAEFPEQQAEGEKPAVEAAQPASPEPAKGEEEPAGVQPATADPSEGSAAAEGEGTPAKADEGEEEGEEGEGKKKRRGRRKRKR